MPFGEVLIVLLLVRGPLMPCTLPPMKSAKTPLEPEEMGKGRSWPVVCISFLKGLYFVCFFLERAS